MAKSTIIGAKLIIPPIPPAGAASAAKATATGAIVNNVHPPRDSFKIYSPDIGPLKKSSLKAANVPAFILSLMLSIKDA